LDPLIFELGSYAIKAGALSHENPPLILRSIYSGSKDYPQFGTSTEIRENLPVISYGSNVNWDVATSFFQLVFQQMGVDPKDHPLLISIHPQRSRESLKKIAEEMFEKHQIPGLYYALKPQMSLYGCGLTTGMSVVMGHDVTSWMPIYDGYCINTAIGSTWLSGRMITQRLKTLITRNNDQITDDSQVDPIKEKCYISENYEAQIQLQQTKPQQFTVPNYYGPDVKLNTELFSAPEILFKPQLEGIDLIGLHYIVNDSILTCPMDLRKELQSNIILSGGTAKLTGLGNRLKYELQDLDEELFSACKIQQEPDSVWKGCRVLAAREKFHSNLLSKDTYDESGYPEFQKLPFPLL